MLKKFKKKYNLSNEDLDRLEEQIESWLQEEQDKEIIFIIKFIKKTYQNIIKNEHYKNITTLLLLCKLTNLEITNYINL
jgi:hypothetical protein